MPNFKMSSFGQLIVRHPYMTAAAAIAPIFTKSDDRGYFRTALLTTPAVIAAGTFLPNLIPSKRTVGVLFRDLTEAIRFKPKVPASNVPVVDVVAKKTRNLTLEANTLDKYIQRRFIKSKELIAKAAAGDARAIKQIAEIDAIQSSNATLLSNAMHSARFSSLSPSEWNDIAAEWETNKTGILDNEQLWNMYKKYTDVTSRTPEQRGRFIRILRQRLHEIHPGNRNRLTYAGPAIGSSLPSNRALTTVTNVMDFDTEWGLDKAQMEFRKQFPEAWENLRIARGKGIIGNPEIVSEKVTTGEVGRLLNIKIKHRGNIKGDLIVPIRDPITGKVYLGSQFEYGGVGIEVLGPSETGGLRHYSMPEWISKLLVERGDIPIKGPGGLEEEIAAHNHWLPGDPLDLHRKAELEAMGPGGENIYNPLQTKIRSWSASVTSAPVFRNSEGDFVSFSELTALERQPIMKQTANNARYIPMGNDASPYELRYQLREAAYLEPWGIVRGDKQDWLWRILSKETSLSSTAEEQLPWWNKSWDALPGDIPLAKGTFHLLDPTDRSIFAELPETYEGFQADIFNIGKKFAASGMSDKEAEDMLAQIGGMYQAGDQGIFAQLGRMGESVTLMDKDFASKFSVTSTTQYEINAGLSIGIGDKVDPTKVMGFMDAVRVSPKYPGTVANVSETIGDRKLINVISSLSMEGAKIDTSVKGMNLTTNMDKMRELLNAFYRRTKSGKFISEDVNTLGTSEYMGDKLDPITTYLGLSRDLTARLQASGDPTLVSITKEYLKKMSGIGAEFIDGQWVIDNGNIDLSDSAMVERLEALSTINEVYFNEAGQAIRKARGYTDPIFAAYENAQRILKRAGKPLQNYGEWTKQNFLELPFGAWSHSLLDVPQQVVLGHDFESFMTLGGHKEGLEMVRRRLQTTSGGDVSQSLTFSKYLMAGKFDQEMGVTVPLSEAFGRSPTKLPLSQASGRANTIFDPDDLAFRENFRVDLGNGKYLPVPGNAAYNTGGNVVKFGGTYETKIWQNALQDVAYSTTAEEQTERAAEYIEKLKSYYIAGKGNVLRPYQYDPYAVPGVLAVASERENLWVARVGEEIANDARTALQREAFRDPNGVVLGYMGRQPTNVITAHAYMLDPSFNGTRDIGVAERAARVHYGDVDRDPITSMFADVHARMENGKIKLVAWTTEADRKAALSMIDSIENPQSRQNRDLAIFEELMGTDEVANRVTEYTPKKLTDVVAKWAENIRNRPDVIMSRTAGMGIGGASNTYTEMIEYMLQGGAGMDPDALSRLRVGLFESLKQTPIAARKVGRFDATTMARITESMKENLDINNSENAAQRIRDLMAWVSNITESKVHDTYWKKDISKIDLEGLMQARTRNARLAADVLKVGTSGVARKRASENLLPRVFATGVEEVMGTAHGGRAATESASKLGAIAEAIGEAGSGAAKSVTGVMGRIFSEHGKGMALGLGALAALGIALAPRTSPVATFSRASSNKHRPEDRIGVSDTIPGEAIPGTMSSMPPRRIEMERPNVKTSVVTPLNRTSDLSVRMRATDQSRAAETARQIAQIPGSGHTNVTINYRDRTKIGSLRNRERIREILQ